MSRAASASPTALHGRVLLLARLTWLALMIPTVGLGVLAQIEFAREPLPDCRTQACEDPFDFTLQDLPLLEQEGLTFFVDSSYELAFAIPLLITYLLTGVVVWRRSDDWVALLVTFSLAALLGLWLTGAVDALLRRYPGLDTPVTTLQSLGLVSWIALAFVFPDGRLVPNRPRLALVTALVVSAAMFGPLLWQGSADRTWTSLAFFLAYAILYVGTLVAGLAAQVYRYRHVSDALQRQQTRWVLLGFTGPVLVTFLVFVAVIFFPSDQPTLARVYFIIAVTPFLLVGILVFPVAVAFSVLRYRLWDFDVVINRTLVYGTLTAVLVGTYVGGIVGMQAAFRAITGQENSLAIVASTLAIAALFQPLRRRLQDLIDRRLYRRKYDAARTLAAFGVRVRDEVDLGALTGELTAVVEETMHPGYVSVWLRPSNARSIGAQVGEP